MGLRAYLNLEVIGDDYQQRRRLLDRNECKRPHFKEWLKIWRYGRKHLQPWVARLNLTESEKIEREFMPSVPDYAQADSIGRRGVFKSYALPDGIYELNECIELGKARRRLVKVSNGVVIEIDRQEMLRCLRNNTSE